MDEVNLALLHELIQIKKLRAIPDEPLDKFLRRAGVIVVKNIIRNTVNLGVLDRIGDGPPYIGAEGVVPFDAFKLGQLKTGDTVLTLKEIWATFPSAKSLEGLSTMEVIKEWLDAIQNRRPITTAGLEPTTVEFLRKEYKAHVISGSRLYVNNLMIGGTTICFGRTAQDIAKYQKGVLEKADTLFAYAWEQPRKLYRKEGRKLTVVQKLSSPDIDELGMPKAILPLDPTTTITSAVNDGGQNTNIPDEQVHEGLATNGVDLLFTQELIMSLPAGTYLISEEMEGAYADRSDGKISVGPSWIAAIPTTKEARLEQWEHIVGRGIDRTGIYEVINPGNLHEDWKKFLSETRYLGTYRDWAIEVLSCRRALPDPNWQGSSLVGGG